MVSDIRAEFDEMLKEIDWMDPGTKARAKKKADNIVEHIGYPSELLDTKKLEELYDGLELNSTHYLGNALNMTVFGTNYAFSQLREKVSIFFSFYMGIPTGYLFYGHLRPIFHFYKLPVLK